MTDAHFHRNGFETYLTLNDREFRFIGLHPWQVDNSEIGIRNSELNTNPTSADVDFYFQSIINELKNGSEFGIGEIGLDRLKTKKISDEQFKAFVYLLSTAAEAHLPVVLHGAKCWGEVVKECKKRGKGIPAFLFHGFSRSTGLVPDIIAINGFISLGPALLNDHAVNYHAMAKELPIDRIMLETDIDWSEQPTDYPSQSALLVQMLDKLARLRGCDAAELAAAIDANVARFVEAIA